MKIKLLYLIILPLKIYVKQEIKLCMQAKKL